MEQRFASVVVEIAKLRDYCLSDAHPRGRHKARLFRRRLGLSSGSAELLRRALFEAVHDRQDDLRPTESDEFGRRYVLDFEMTTAVGTAAIRSAWIVPAGGDVLRFVTCYVL